MMFRIKICGVTSVADAQAAVEAGADAIGLNFYSGSPRYVPSIVAQQISANVGDRVTKVGVYVNATSVTICETCALTDLPIAQLHGNEPPDFLQQLADQVRVIRVRRLGQGGMEEVGADIVACRAAADCAPFAVLIDAAAPGAYGGSGVTADWDRIAGYRRWLGDVPLILAGGLKPENVAEAIHVVRPQAVDVASGVESSPGKKDAAKIRDFVAAARAAFSE